MNRTTEILLTTVVPAALILIGLVSISSIPRIAEAPGAGITTAGVAMIIITGTLAATVCVLILARHLRRGRASSNDN